MLLLVAGDRIPADAQILHAERLLIDTSTLTGEGEPTTFEVGEQLHAGTFVVEGEGDAVVTAIGSFDTPRRHRPADDLDTPSGQSVDCGTESGGAHHRDVLFVPPIARQLGHANPPLVGWLVALASAPLMLAVDAANKARRRRRQINGD